MRGEIEEEDTVDSWGQVVDTKASKAEMILTAICGYFAHNRWITWTKRKRGKERTWKDKEKRLRKSVAHVDVGIGGLAALKVMLSEEGAELRLDAAEGLWVAVQQEYHVNHGEALTHQWEQVTKEPWTQTHTKQTQSGTGLFTSIYNQPEQKQVK